LGAEGFGTTFVRIKEDEDGVGMAQERDLDVMLDSKLTLAIMSDSQRHSSRGTNRTVKMDIDVAVAAEQQPAFQEDWQSGHFPMSFDDRYDDIRGHGVTAS